MANSIPILVQVTPGTPQPGVSLNRSANRAQVNLSSSIRLPEGARNTSISLKRMTAFYSFPNILEGDSLSLDYSTDAGNTYTLLSKVDLLQGLYDATALSIRISTLLEEDLDSINAALGTDFASGAEVLSIKTDAATDKCVYAHGFSDWLSGTNRIRITATDRLGLVLGSPAPVILNPASPHEVHADVRAYFNQVNSLMVATDLVNNPGTTASLVNSIDSSNFLEMIPIDARPGRQIIFNQVIDAKVPIQIPNHLSRYSVTITNDQGEDVIMTNQWSVLLSLNYDV